METVQLAKWSTLQRKPCNIRSPEQGFTLGLNIDDGIPPVLIDRDAILQAILNLLTNAMKYSGQSRNIELQLS